MNGDLRPELGQILRAIDFGDVSHEEIERRLNALIEAESEKTDGPADMAMIEACQALLLQLHDCHPDTAYISSAGVQNDQRKPCRKFIGWRIAIAAAVIVLVVGAVGYRYQWLEGTSTLDGQQYIVQGHEITTAMIETAIAEHSSYAQCQIRDTAELISFLGFDPCIPSELAGKWQAEQYDVLLLPNFIQINIKYTSSSKSDHDIVYTQSWFLNVKEAFMSIEQNAEGESFRIESTDVYMSQNSERILLLWQEGLSANLLSVENDMDTIMKVVQEMIGGNIK